MIFYSKNFFGEQKNTDLLKDLLQSILTDIQIKTIQINKDVSLERKLITEKLGILDILATLNDNTNVNIEMQVKNYHNTVERSLFYGTGIYHENLESGANYIDIPTSISIWITNYNIFKNGPFHEKARLKRDFNNEVLTDKLQFHYIQLPKFREKCKRISSKLDEWLVFIINENLEEIKMINNKNIKKAEKELEYLTGDEEIRRLAYLREKAIRDEMAAMAQARKEGETNRNIQIAKKMLEKGIDITIISEITSLTKEEIEKL